MGRNLVENHHFCPQPVREPSFGAASRRSSTLKPGATLISSGWVTAAWHVAAMRNRREGFRMSGELPQPCARGDAEMRQKIYYEGHEGREGDAGEECNHGGHGEHGEGCDW